MRKLIEINLDRLLALNPFERLFQMGQMIVFDHIDPAALWEIFPHDQWPIAFMKSEGKIIVEEYKTASKSPLFGYPIPIEKNEFYKVFESNAYDGVLANWTGNNVIIDYGSRYYEGKISMHGALKVSGVPIEQSHYVAYAQFLHSPWEGNPPCIQSVFMHDENLRDSVAKGALYKKGFENPKSFNSYELFQLNELDRSGIKFIKFSPPFDNFFSYGSRIVNISHPAGQDLMRFICCIKSEEIGANLSRGLLGTLDDLIKQYSSSHIRLGFIESSWLKPGRKETNIQLNEIWRQAKDAGIPNLVNMEDAIPSADDFVPGTIIDPDTNYIKFKPRSIRKFGEPI
jgi:hypothetical protein